MIQQVVRQLTAKEQRVLRLAMANRARARRRTLTRGSLVSLVVSAALCALTLVASKAPAHAIIGFWLTFAVLMFVWLAVGEVRRSGRSLRAYASALRNNQAEVTRITSSVVVELEEVEDEGACFAYALPEQRLAFICGQEFYPSARFPNSDFSLVSIRDESGNLVASLIEKHGVRVTPCRTVPRSVRQKLRTPAHLEVVHGTPDSVESCLSVPPSGAHAA